MSGVMAVYSLNGTTKQITSKLVTHSGIEQTVLRLSLLFLMFNCSFLSIFRT